MTQKIFCISNREVKKEGLLISFYLLPLLLTCLLKYFLPSLLTKMLPFISLIFLILHGIRKNKMFSWDIADFSLIIFSILFAIDLFKYNYTITGLGTVLSLVGITLLYLISKKYPINFDFLLIFTMCLCVCFVISQIVEVYNPEYILNFSRKFNYDSFDYSNMASWVYSNGYYSGIFPDRATISIYSAILVFGSIYYFFNTHKNSIKILNSFLGLFGLLGIILSAKRGPFIAVIISVIVMYVIYCIANRKKLYKFIIVSLFFILFISIFVIYNPFASSFVSRFIDTDDIFTGRLTIYGYLLNNFSSNILFGIGTGYTAANLGVAGHNVYLTILSENGIICFILYCFFIVFELNYVIKKYFNQNSNKNKNSKYLLFAILFEIFYIIYSFSGNPLYDNYILYFYFICLIISKSKLSFCVEKNNYGRQDEIRFNNISRCK